MTTRDLTIALKSKWDDSGTTDAAKGLTQTEGAAKKVSRELGNLEKQAKQQGEALAKGGAQADRFAKDLDDVGRTAIRTRKLLEDATKRLPEVEITADSSDAERAVADLSKRLGDLSSKRIGIDIDARAAADETEKIRRELTALAAMHPEVVVGANIERALNDLQKVEREARDLDRRVTVKVDVDGASAASAAIGMIQTALAAVRSSGPATGIAVGGALAALPAVAALASSAIVVGLGGALAGIGLAAAHGSDAAQDAIGHLHTAVEREAAVMGKPFEAVWTTIVQVAERELGELSPVIRQALSDLAPDVQQFVKDAGASLEELSPAIQGVERAFEAVLRQLGPRMPEIMQHLAGAITQITDAVEKDPQLLADFALNISKIAESATKAIVGLSGLVRWTQENAKAVAALLAVVSPAAAGVALFAEQGTKAGRTSLDLGQATRDTTKDVVAIGQASDEASQKMREGWSSAYGEFAKLGQALSGAQQLASGQQSLAQAQERAAETRRQGAEKIARAEQQLADTEEQSAERVAAAKQRVKDAHRAAADAIEQAQGRVRDAQAAVTAAVEQGAQREADAQRRVEDARAQAAQAAVDSARRIADAERALADAQTDAAARQVDADRRVTDAHKRVQAAVEDLTAAREQAQQRLEDLIAAESGAAMDEEGAQIAIDRARERLNEVNADPAATDVDRHEADYAFRQALARLDEVQRRNAQLRDDLADAQQKGIEGSTEVVDALGRIEDARQAEGDAAAAAAKQREDSARTISDAEQALADAYSDASRQREESARAVADAEGELDRTRVENAKAVADAQKDVASAQKDAAQVAQDSARQVADAQAEAARAVKDAAKDVIDAETRVRDTRKEVAKDTRDANDSVLESWAKLRGDATLTSDQLLTELGKQVKDQEAWADNLISLAGRVPPEMLDELAKLGPGAAGVVATAADMSDAELAKLINLYGRSGKSAGDTFAQNLQEAGPVLRSIAAQQGQDIADKVREGMDGGRRSVYESAAAIGVEIDKGIGMDRTITVFVKTDYQDDLSRAALRAAVGMADGGILTYADGGIRSFADGGEHHIAQIASANTIRMWAEPETGGEAYIPLAASKRGRSEDVLSEVATKFGGRYYRNEIPVSSSHVSAGSGGAYRPSSVYNVTVNGGLDSGPEIGRRVVDAIQDYERGSGAAWRRTT